MPKLPVDWRGIEAVSFDAGGTLIEPWPSVGAIYAEVAREFGIPCTPERLTAQFVAAWKRRTGFRYTRVEWLEVVRHSFEGMAEVSPGLFDAIYERFARPEAWLIYDDVIPALQRIEKLGLGLLVISNWDERIAPLLEALGLATYFQQIVVSSAIGAHKPDRRIFEHTAQLAGVPANRILHVGDSQREDVEGARQVGMAACRIRRSGVETADDTASLVSLAAVLESARR